MRDDFGYRDAASHFALKKTIMSAPFDFNFNLKWFDFLSNKVEGGGERLEGGNWQRNVMGGDSFTPDL